MKVVASPLTGEGQAMSCPLLGPEHDLDEFGLVWSPRSHGLFRHAEATGTFPMVLKHFMVE